jgi:hypothetical protein
MVSTVLVLGLLFPMFFVLHLVENAYNLVGLYLLKHQASVSAVGPSSARFRRGWRLDGAGRPAAGRS